jgi:predicted GNAT family N-acyltransferase
LIRFATKGLPDIGTGTFNPNVPPDVLRRRAEQMSEFMRRVVHFFFVEDLHVRHIDTDPPPAPENGDEIIRRMDRFKASGLVEDTGLQYVLAMALNKKGTPSDDLVAIKGLLALKKPGLQLCTGEEHTPTEILEFAVAPECRGRKLGHFMLQQGLPYVHPEDQLVLDVPEPDYDTRTICEVYGFRYTGESPLQHGIYDVNHLPMAMPAGRLQERLGVTPLLNP